MLFKDLATLRVDRTLLDGVEDIEWTGPTPGFAASVRPHRRANTSRPGPPNLAPVSSPPVAEQPQAEAQLGR